MLDFLPPEWRVPAFILAITLIVIAGSISRDGWIKRHPKPLPTFCTECGCPLIRSWRLGRHHFDSQEGSGQRIDRAVLACKTALKEDGRYASNWHAYVELDETRTVQVESLCASRD